jgi:GNAT superfamily N-acetyltransferase
MENIQAMNFEISGPHLKQGKVCEPIIRSLPDWFGIEEPIVQYAIDIDHLPTFTATVEDQVIGFLTIKQHNPYAAEVYVMGVLINWHRQGVGRALLALAQDWLRQEKVEYLQVKTLAPSHPDEDYARTRAFYLAVGFRPLEELTGLWNEENPCLLMIKRL